MLDIVAIQKTIYDWVSTTTGLTTIWLDPNAPRPPKPYIAMRISNFEMIAQDYVSAPDDLGNIALIGNREFTLEVDYYGINSLGIMDNLRTSLQQHNTRASLELGGLVYVNSTAITDLTALLDNQYERRYMVEITFRMSNQMTSDLDKYEVGLIESAGVTYSDE